MKPWLVPGLALLLVTGCQESRAPTVSSSTIPGDLQGTWRTDTGYVALGETSVVLRIDGHPSGLVSVRSVARAGTAAAVTLSDGRTLLLAPGRALRTVRRDDLDLLGTGDYLDVAVDQQQVRLWREDGMTWLVRGTAVAPPAPPAAAVVPAPTTSPSADDRFLAEVAALADPRWHEAGRDLIALARSQAGPGAIEEAIADTERRQRLRVVDLLAAATGPEDGAVAVADRLLLDLPRWREAVRRWSDEPRSAAR